MSRERVRPLELDIVGDERPAKRSRGDSFTSITSSSDQAIDRSTTASETSDEYFSRETFKSSAIDESSTCSSPPASTVPMKEASEAVDLSLTTTREKGEDATKLTYIYQRQEYDEGMHVYCDLMSLDDSSGENIRSAGILFNKGRHATVSQEHKKAVSLFELALIRLDMGPSTQQSALVSVKILHNLGHCNYRLGNNLEAARAYGRAMAIAKGSFLESIHSAACMNCIAVLLFHNDSSNLDKALKYFEQSLETYQGEGMGESKEAATVLNNIGRVHYLRADYQKALQVYDEALEIRRKTLGTNSIDVAATVCNSGQTHHQLGQLDAAMSKYKEFLDLAQAELGSDHRDIAIIHKCMAEIHHERGEREEAKREYETALRTGTAALGHFHPEVASTLNKLGNLLYEMGSLDAALMCYTEGLKIERNVLDEAHPHILVTLMNIAQIHRIRGKFSLAFLKYGEIRDLQIKKNGGDSLEVANTVSNMALMQYQLKGYARSFDMYQEALRIQRDHYGSDDHAEIASTLNSIGLVLFNQGVFQLAKHCFIDSLKIRQKVLGVNHRDVAILWYNIATIYLEIGEDDVAVKLYKETLRVERAALGCNHDDVILTLQHLGLVHQQRGELEEALGYFSEALAIERTKDGRSHIAVGKLLNLIGNIELQQANIHNMMKCYVEASRIYRQQSQANDTLVIAGYNFYGLSKLHPPCAPQA